LVTAIGGANGCKAGCDSHAPGALPSLTMPIGGCPPKGVLCWLMFTSLPCAESLLSSLNLIGSISISGAGGDGPSANDPSERRKVWAIASASWESCTAAPSYCDEGTEESMLERGDLEVGLAAQTEPVGASTEAAGEETVGGARQDAGRARCLGGRGEGPGDVMKPQSLVVHSGEVEMEIAGGRPPLLGKVMLPAHGCVPAAGCKCALLPGLRCWTSARVLWAPSSAGGVGAAGSIRTERRRPNAGEEASLLSCSLARTGATASSACCARAVAALALAICSLASSEALLALVDSASAHFSFSADATCAVCSA